MGLPPRATAPDRGMAKESLFGARGWSRNDMGWRKGREENRVEGGAGYAGAGVRATLSVLPHYHTECQEVSGF